MTFQSSMTTSVGNIGSTPVQSLSQKQNKKKFAKSMKLWL